MSSGKKRRPERIHTDESLQREREKTDREIERGRPLTEARADRVLARARDRAAATLDVARERADATLESTYAAPAALAAVAENRAREDEVLEDERRAAAAALHEERAAKKDALVALLRIERDETDERLLLERDRADDVVASRDNFLAMVSHDLRNLLGGVALSAASLRNAPDQRSREDAERIQRCTVRMTRLVGDLIDVVSMEAGKLSLAPERLDARPIVLELVETFRPNAASKGMHIDVRIGEGDLTSTFDAQRVQQVLANIIGNALKFTGHGGVIEVTLDREGDDLHFCVLDNGPGIARESAARIFERFWQSSAGDRRGLGLGLYISRSIVDAHGGKIWVEQRPGGGSAFHFTLPVR